MASVGFDTNVVSGSVAVRKIVSPFFSGIIKSILKLPPASAIPVPITLPAASLISIFLPGSALPVTTVPSCTTATSVGDLGTATTGALASVAIDVKLLKSVAVTLMLSPCVKAVPSVTAYVPSFSAIVVPIKRS